MDVLFIIGRIIYGGYFIHSGINHFTKRSLFSESAGKKGVPMPSVAVPFAGLMLISGGLSLSLGAFPVVGVSLLIGFLVPVAFIMHSFWKIQDPQIRGVERRNFLRNCAFSGALSMILSIPRPWPISL